MGKKVSTIVESILGHSGRIYGSKSIHSYENDKNLIVYNSNVATAEDGKIWHGDMDITKEGKKVIELAKKLKRTVYVLREMDGRFDNETEPRIDKYVYMVKNIEGLITPVLGDDYLSYYELKDGIPILVEKEIIINNKKVIKKIKIEDFDEFSSEQKKDKVDPLMKMYNKVIKEMGIDIQQLDIQSIFLSEDDEKYMTFLVRRFAKKQHPGLHVVKIDQSVGWHFFDIGPGSYDKKELKLEDGYIYIAEGYIRK